MDYDIVVCNTSTFVCLFLSQRTLIMLYFLSCPNFPVTITALFRTNFRLDFPFDLQELPAFAIIGWVIRKTYCPKSYNTSSLQYIMFLILTDCTFLLTIVKAFNDSATQLFFYWGLYFQWNAQMGLKKLALAMSWCRRLRPYILFMSRFNFITVNHTQLKVHKHETAVPVWLCVYVCRHFKMILPKPFNG